MDLKRSIENLKANVGIFILCNFHLCTLSHLFCNVPWDYLGKTSLGRLRCAHRHSDHSPAGLRGAGHVYREAQGPQWPPGIKKSDYSKCTSRKKFNVHTFFQGVYLFCSIFSNQTFPNLPVSGVYNLSGWFL
jgi:hypothetical protein